VFDFHQTKSLLVFSWLLVLAGRSAFASSNNVPLEHGRRKNFFQGGATGVKFHFANSKPRETHFLLKNIKIQGREKTLPTPMHLSSVSNTGQNFETRVSGS